MNIHEMTEEEILNQTAAAIHEYLLRIRPLHGEFVLEDCLDRQVKALTALFRSSRRLARRDALSPGDVQELDLMVQHLLPRMREQATAVQLSYTKELTKWKIRGISATESIKQAFGDAGLKAGILCQKFRAKVVVDLGGRSLLFYVPYKTLEQPDTLPKLVQAVLDLKDAACRIGGDIKLYR